MTQGIKKFIKGSVIGNIELLNDLGNYKWEYICKICGHIGTYSVVSLCKKDSLPIEKKNKCICPQIPDKIGGLDVIEKESINNVHIKCDCGNILSDSLVNLRKKYSNKKSCGCKISLNNFNNRIGERHGHIVVTAYLGNKLWEVVCDCGRKETVETRDLRRGVRKYCGLLCNLNPCKTNLRVKKDKVVKSKVVKEKLNNLELKAKKIYRGMINRVNRDHNYSSITVCKDWQDNYNNFINDMGIPLSEEYSIDRIDNNKGYNKENCRWATKKEQIRNRKNTVYITYSNQTLSLPDWCDKFNLSYKHVYAYYHRHGVAKMIAKYFE